VRSPDRRAVVLLVLLTSLNILSWVDRQIIPAVAPLLIAELGLTSAQIGLLYGYAFILCFIVAGTILGTLADRVHRPRLIAAGLAVWSLFTGVSGLARSFAQLAGARVMVGIGEATLTPAALAMLSDVFPGHWRARAAGIFAVGLPIGAGLSLIVAGILAPRYGWRACFLVLGIVGVLAAFGIAMVPDVERRVLPVRRALTGRQPLLTGHHQPFRDFLVTLRHSPPLALTVVGGVIITFSTAATIHATTWLVQERGYEFREAAILGGGLYALTGTIGNIGGGWFADVCAARWRGGRLWSMVIAQAVLMPPTLLFFTSPQGSAAFYIGWVLSGLRGTIWFGPLYAAVQDLAPSHARATAVAFLLLALNLFGAGPGPWVAGAIGDRWSLTQGLLVTTWIGLAAIVPFALAARAVKAAE
jgi:MFS transporter, Spinster family, sphingosine-1-phosphate transporter